MSTASSGIRDWLPPMLIRAVGPYLGWRIRFSGHYKDWKHAAAKSIGYSAEDILDRVCAAMLKVKRGVAASERDAVVFNEPQPPFPLLTALLRAASQDNNQLCVVDFGGSLGTSYYHCRPFLGTLKTLRWNVVEQVEFVRCGKEKFEDESLRFYHAIEECPCAIGSAVVLLSGALQYLEKPYDLIKTIVDLGARSIIIDRTPTVSLLENRLVRQVVPSRLGRASYPIWLFNRQRLLAPFLSTYRLVSAFDAVDGIMSYRMSDVVFKGFILDKK